MNIQTDITTNEYEKRDMQDFLCHTVTYSNLVDMHPELLVSI